jgi:UDP-N-acetylglucosamine acyltransferase
MRSGSEVCGSGSLKIHPTAIVHPDAELGEGVEVGPYSIIAGTVKIGSGTVIAERVSIEGNTTIGSDNEIFAGAIIGSRTQDKKFKGGLTYLRIGDRNKIREYVTINPGTKDGTETAIGDDNLLMAYAHVAHDCIIKSHAILANAATLAGHVIVEDRAIIGGLSAVHQFVHIGKLALVGGCSKVVQDVPPFMIADGHPARVYGLNTVGLDRAGFAKDEKVILRKAFKTIFKSGLTVKNAIAAIEADRLSSPSLNVLIDFLKQSDRGICR